MGKSQETWNKKETEKKRLKKKQDKEEKKLEKKSNPKSSLDDMIAYVDEYGNFSSTPPNPNKKKTEIKESDIVLGATKHETVQDEPIRNGLVRNFNDAKGYGFILDLKSQESIFVHASGLVNIIKEGDKVTFEIQIGAKGPNAVNVKQKTA